MSHNYVFFWESTSPFSNWYPCPFVHDMKQFNCSEQYMMYRKAMLFKDYEVAQMIMEQNNPRNQKFLGRQVRNYIDKEWMEVCQDIMVEGLISKFMQDPYSLQCLLDTGEKIIVEASPYDKIWGIGLSKDDLRALDESQWLGQNLLGKVLMRARDAIRTL